MTDLARVQRMTDGEADAWYRDLMSWIRKNHPHLFEGKLDQKHEGSDE